MENIYSYTRADAIRDGVLIDVTEMAKEAGIKFPVALTRAVFAKIENKPDFEDINGRTWDVIWMLKCAIIGAIPSKKVGKSMIYYKVILNDEKLKRKIATFKAMMHGGDASKPVITVMLPDED